MTSSLQLISEPEPALPFCGMVGSHPLMLALFDEIRCAAPLATPVLIEGETGTGKELVAQALHRLSARKGRLVTLNASELAEPLAEAELFGVTKGAYTGAVSSREGLLMAADGGTLFLDEAGDLSLHLQSKLLRVLEAGRVRPVGAGSDRPVRLRLLVTVQRSARDLVAAGRWRPDFFYRVSGLVLRTPRLVDRLADLPALTSHFLREQGSGPLTPDQLALFASQRWRGNIRELRRVIERLTHSARGRAPKPEDIRVALEAEGVGERAFVRPPATRTLRDVEREHIEGTLRDVGGDWHRAAAALGLSRSGFYRKLHSLGIPAPSRRVFPKAGTASHVWWEQAVDSG